MDKDLHQPAFIVEVTHLLIQQEKHYTSMPQEKQLKENKHMTHNRATIVNELFI